MTESEKLLTGTQAAEFLGVKPATLYAYVSRGMLDSVPGLTARQRSYRLSDLIRLRQSNRGYKASDNEDSTWTGPVIKSAITEIRDDGHYYRGVSAIELAKNGTAFEDVAELLWETSGDIESWQGQEPLPIPAHLADAAAEVDSLDLLKGLLVAAEMSDPVPGRLTADGIFETARRLIVTMPRAIVTDRGQNFPDTTSIAENLLFALTGDSSKERASLVNCALVLCADHELNASALAARIAASCDASLYSCLLSALSTFSGTSHGSASRRAEDIVGSSLKFDTTRAWLNDYLRKFEHIPGFGTELYSGGDPRARLLIEMAHSASDRDPRLARLEEIVACIRELLGLEPNLDFGLAAMSYALHLPPGSGTTIFAVSRTAGWIAHAAEQRSYGGSIRPRARYIGKA